MRNKPSIGWRPSSAWARPAACRPGRLAADAQALDQLLVSLGRSVFEVIQQAPALSHQAEKTPAGMMILGMGLEVILQLEDPLAQNRNLHFRRAHIGLMKPIFVNHLRFRLLGQRHSTVTAPSPIPIRLLFVKKNSTACQPLALGGDSIGWNFSLGQTEWKAPGLALATGMGPRESHSVDRQV